MSRGTLDTAMSALISLTGLSPSPAGLSSAVLLSLRNHVMRSEPRSARTPVWAPSGSLAATSEITFCFLLLRLLRCFSSPGSLPYTIRICILFMHGCTGSSRAGFPIQISADHRVCAPPRSFSQLVTSFFGSQCQGILPAPFPA